MRKSALVVAPLALSALILAGCSSGDDAATKTVTETTSAAPSRVYDRDDHDRDDHDRDDHDREHAAAMHMHNEYTDMPDDMVAAKDPKFPVGSEVILTADHMPGMDGAKAKVVGAYNTTAYEVNYFPTTGGPEVKNHKWIVQQEIDDADGRLLAPGTPIVIEAEHMPGMEDARGTVVSSTQQTVYMVDVYVDGKIMKNHKWVVQDEMRAA